MLAVAFSPPWATAADAASALSKSSFLAVHLIPVSTTKNGGSSKSRKRIMPDPVTEPPTVDPVYEALLYCNIPSVAERSMEGRPAVEAWASVPK